MSYARSYGSPLKVSPTIGQKAVRYRAQMSRVKGGGWLVYDTWTAMLVVHDLTEKEALATAFYMNGGAATRSTMKESADQHLRRADPKAWRDRERVARKFRFSKKQHDTGGFYVHDAIRWETVKTQITKEPLADAICRYLNNPSSLPPESDRTDAARIAYEYLVGDGELSPTA